MIAPAEHRGGFLPLLYLMLLFTALALLVTGLGAHLYQSVLDRADDSYALRASLSYLSGKLRAFDSAACLTLSQTDEGETLLTLTETIDGETYATYLYCHDGALCELSTRAGLPFSPGEGTALVELSALKAELSQSLLILQAESVHGRVQRCQIALRCLKEAVPDA